MAAAPGEKFDVIYVGFNTQPPEGGCKTKPRISSQNILFQYTATRRWLHLINLLIITPRMVSIHSHPKVAAYMFCMDNEFGAVSIHSHPKVAAINALTAKVGNAVSIHSHPKVAACK